MRCSDTGDCFNQIGAYFDGKKTGHFLLVNTENYDIYQLIRHRLEADERIDCVYVSKECLPNGLPDVDAALSRVCGGSRHALIGLSQAQMLRSREELVARIKQVLETPISGYCVILLDHCEDLLKNLIDHDLRLKNTILLVEGESSPLPRIRFVHSMENCIGFTPLPNLSSLLSYLERLSNEKVQRRSVVTVVCPFSAELFNSAVYSITASKGIYEALAENYPNFAGAMEKEYGDDTQWTWLATKMSNKSSFSALICDEFGCTVNLSAHLSKVCEANDSNRCWLLWLALKLFGEAADHYLTRVLKNSRRVDDLIEHVYLDLADIDISDPEFERYYIERKRLVEQLPENLALIERYCDQLHRISKEEVFYLTDLSDQEKYEFMRCLALYDYTDKELDCAIRRFSKSLFLYVQDFVFDSVNTKLPQTDESFRTELTKYFREYKQQKLTNRIYPEFLEKVNVFSQSPRPYNKLQSRSSILSHMDRKGMQCFFLDALGVEYLAFIAAKCEEYGLMSEVLVGRCELPSITEKNKEFLQYFADGDWRKIDDLDEMKHHSQVYDYRKCTYPIHLFEELEVIDRQLRMIRSMLMQGTVKKALIVSDHGASRLAVLYGHELETCIALDEPGEHSGRCCPAKQDPNLPFAAYEDGFSILANYERFKGGRRANVEVHGGASLEEVLVPVIVLTKRPEKIEICFVNPIINIKPRVVPELELYFNFPLSKPRLLIEGEFYEGVFEKDRQHARFQIPKIKRKGEYSAQVYDGDKNLSVELMFKAQKQTREVELF